MESRRGFSVAQPDIWVVHQHVGDLLNIGANMGDFFLAIYYKDPNLKKKHLPSLKLTATLHLEHLGVEVFGLPFGEKAARCEVLQSGRVKLEPRAPGYLLNIGDYMYHPLPWGFS